MRLTGQTRFTWLLLALGSAAGLAVLFFLDPATQAVYPRCPLKTLAGLECPTCGGLRAAHQLLHGHVRAAFAMNPFLFFVFPVVVLFLIRPALARPRWVPWAALGILAAYFIWRNAT